LVDQQQFQQIARAERGLRPPEGQMTGITAYQGDITLVTEDGPGFEAVDDGLGGFLRGGGEHAGSPIVDRLGWIFKSHWFNGFDQFVLFVGSLHCIVRWQLSTRIDFLADFSKPDMPLKMETNEAFCFLCLGIQKSIPVDKI
jgi:hypothetical protein